MEHPMMKCGHAANSTHNGKPSCVICFGIVEGADEIANTPDLSNRKSKCSCGNTVPSNTELAFFEYRPDREYDNYFCGCLGWD
jgi:hypothetical protein